MSNRKESKSKILVVDDDQEFTGQVIRALDSLDAETRPSYDRQDALVQFDQFQPQIVVLDLLLPKRGGFYLLQKWKGSRDKKGKLPFIIMVTAQEGSRHKQFAEQLGVDEYLRKPFAMSVLVDLVKSYLQKLDRLVTSVP